MKILHLAEFYAPVGGLEQHLISFCEVCEKAGHPTAVVHATATGREPVARRPVHHIPGVAGPTPAPREALEMLDGILTREAPDIVVLHEILESQVVHLVTGRAPTIRFVHGYKMICPGGRRQLTRSGTICERSVGVGCQVMAYLERCMPRDPRQGLPLIARSRKLAGLHRDRSETMVPSHFLRGLLLRNGFSASRIHVVPYFTEIPISPVGPSEPVPGRLLCAARLTPEKGVDQALQALALLPPPTHLVVAGDGPARISLERLAGALGIQGRVTFTGWLSRPAMARAFQETEIVVVPSLWPETFGIVGIEAMAHGRPVVAYDSGGVTEWLRPGETGHLLPRGAIPGMAQVLRILRDDPGRRSEFGVRGRQIVEERFSPRRHLHDFLGVAEAARDRWLRGARRSPVGGDL